MKAFYTSILVLMAGTAFGQSNLPACRGDPNYWTNCYGVSNVSPNSSLNGTSYKGEFKNGKFDGYGSYQSRGRAWRPYIFRSLDYSGDYKYSGNFAEGKFSGIGKMELKDGRVLLGNWKDDNPHGGLIFYRSDKTIERSGLFEYGNLVSSQYIDPNSFTQIAKNDTAPAVPDSQRQAIEQRERQIQLEVQRVAEERRKLDADKRQRELAKQNSRITISATATQPDSSGVVTITIQTNTDTSSLKINGEELGGKPDGSYSVKKVARVGQETKFTIVGVDVNGNTESKTITVVRQAVDSKAVFSQLNAANVKQQPTRDAVAIIIGIEKYKRVAKADFANADAQVFYDYANRALGIKPENIKLLIDDGADDAEIYRAFQNWLPLKVKKGKTEVFVFFSGHGLPSQDGKSLYLLPWGVDKDFVEKTAINQQEIISSLQAVQPKSVTMFLDSCYSGQARGGETLVASARPIALKAEANAYPPNFTVISASAPDQLSSSSPDLKHGIFSYYLMKGMEGDADQNKDGKITVAEIQEYLTDMVGRQAMGMNRKQQPQLFGDADRVLVGR
jgi:hypothetical protein